MKRAARPDADSPRGASTSARLLTILDLFDVERPTVHVDEVVAALDVGVSTAYRYLRELADVGLIASRGKGTYTVGRRVVELERILQIADPLLVAGKPVLDALVPECRNRAVLLCAPYGDRVLCVHQVGVEEIRHRRRVMTIQRGRGISFPLFKGAGSQIILAHLPPHRIKSLYLQHPESIAEAGLGANWTEFRQALTAMRRAGHVTTTGRLNAGMLSVAVPILRADGYIAGSLLMLGALDERDGVQALLRTLRSSADAIAAALPDDPDDPTAPRLR